MTGPSKFGLKIRKHSTVITFDVKKAPFYVRAGELIVVETTRGEEAGVVVKLPVPCEKHGLHEDIRIRQIIRIATEQDKKILEQLPTLEQEYLQKANQVFESKTDSVKLISCELLFNQKKLFLYYRGLETEENTKAQDKNKKKHPEKSFPKFNSKEMNKDLFQQLGIPLELKEMGNRASAYVIGGLGHCGCGLCCTTWLHKPKQVSVKMAKEQSLAINIPKLSGVCGKLLCCIAYEHAQYENGYLQDLSKKEKTSAPETEFNNMFERG
jgi:cell fate regulator YaaT (PSP1 superfamily)